jgi:hypothetical protein
MNMSVFNSSSEFQELASQIESGQPIFGLPTFSESQSDGRGSQLENSSSYQQPKFHMIFKIYLKRYNVLYRR